MYVYMYVSMLISGIALFSHILQVSRYSVPSTTQADCLCCQGSHSVDLGASSADHVSCCCGTDCVHSSFPLHGLQWWPQPHIPFVHLLWKLYQPSDEQGLHGSPISAHLPSAPLCHHSDVLKHQRQTVILSGCKQRAAAGQRHRSGWW